MFSKLTSLLRSGTADPPLPPGDPGTLAPEHTLIVVGDLHGCLDLLKQTLERIDAHIEAEGPEGDPAPRLVLVGDYVDRGPDSAGVLRHVHELQKAMPEQVICLMGNHEWMMLDFLADPAGKGPRWLNNGGVQTLASFGIGGVTPQSPLEDLSDAADALEAAMPEGLLDWLRRLPLSHSSGNVICVHAAMDPYLPLRDQLPEVLLWGQRDFLKRPRNDDLWVVHGHTIFKQPQFVQSRISIDTGAFHTGRLSVAYIRPGRCEFI